MRKVFVITAVISSVIYLWNDQIYGERAKNNESVNNKLNYKSIEFRLKGYLILIEDKLLYILTN